MTVAGQPLRRNSFEEPLQVLLEVHPSLRSGFTSHEPMPARMREVGDPPPPPMAGVGGRGVA